ncbi:MAG: flippase-like domain-containing protein [Acetobacteraceae bacterium]|nr:flippase-like domain-containing protein [Acetobacteraceae bacterium]
MAWGAVARLRPSRSRVISMLLTGTLVLGMVAACFLVMEIGQAVLRALPALPLGIAVHTLQLAATAMAWRCLFHAPRPGVGSMLRARWIRESLNGLLPLVGIGGGVLAGLAIARQTDRPFAGVAAGATVDLLIESVTELPFLLAGLAVFALLAPGTLSLSHVGALVLPLALATALAASVRLGVGREAALRLLRRIGFDGALRSLRESLAVVNSGTGPIAQAAAWHLLAWTLGAAEVWAILAVLGTQVSLAEAYVIESLGMAARSLGFVLPAGLGAQEAGLAAVGVALGVPPQEAIAMAMLKRLREVLMNVPGLVVWQWTERQAAAASGGD